MKRYKLLTNRDLIPNNKYDAIVVYPFNSPNRNPMLERVYYDQFEQWYGTANVIVEIVDESVIEVLFNYNPERATEILHGGYEEDGKYNDIICTNYFSVNCMG